MKFGLVIIDEKRSSLLWWAFHMDRLYDTPCSWPSNNCSARRTHHTPCRSHTCCLPCSHYRGCLIPGSRRHCPIRLLLLAWYSPSAAISLVSSSMLFATEIVAIIPNGADRLLLSCFRGVWGMRLIVVVIGCRRCSRFGWLQGRQVFTGATRCCTNDVKGLSEAWTASVRGRILGCVLCCWCFKIWSGCARQCSAPFDTIAISDCRYSALHQVLLMHLVLLILEGRWIGLIVMRSSSRFLVCRSWWWLWILLWWLLLFHLFNVVDEFVHWVLWSVVWLGQGVEDFGHTDCQKLIDLLLTHRNYLIWTILGWPTHILMQSLQCWILL